MSEKFAQQKATDRSPIIPKAGEPAKQRAAQLGGAGVGGTAPWGPGGPTLVPFDVDPFRFYNRKLAHPVPAFEVSHPEVPFASEYTERQLEEMESQAAAHAAPYDEVWVIVRSPNSAVRRELAFRTERAAAAGRRLTGRWRWDSAGGPLRVARYDRAPGR